MPGYLTNRAGAGEREGGRGSQCLRKIKGRGGQKRERAALEGRRRISRGFRRVSSNAPEKIKTSGMKGRQDRLRRGRF